MRIAMNVIYGAGVDGKKLFRLMTSCGFDVDFFIDEFSGDREYQGKKIYRIDEVSDKGKVRLFLSIMAILPFSKNDQITLIEGLKREGFGDIVPINKVQSMFGAIEYGDHCDYGRYLDKFYDFIKFYEKPNDNKQIDWLRANLADDQSVTILDRVLELRSDVKKGPLLGLPEQTPQYFPHSVDILRGITKLRFVDCGASDGDTIKDVIRYSVVPVDYIASFESEFVMFSKMHKVINEISARFNTISFLTYSAGVWSKNGFCLNKNNDSCANISANDCGPAIPVLSLDSALLSTPPNFIKMDIEGAEEEALRGAEKIIQQYHPTLAISIYHRHDDLWRLPQLIRKFYPEYELYIRHHFWGPWETVLYCVAPGGPAIK